MDKLVQSGPCCGMTIYYDPPLDIKFSEVDDPEGFTQKAELVGFPEVCFQDETLVDAMDGLSHELCLFMQTEDPEELGESEAACRFTQSRIKGVRWEVPSTLQIHRTTKSTVELQFNTIEG